MSKRFKLIPAVYLVLTSQQPKGVSKVLLTRRYGTGYEDGKYSMIAGHLEGDESLTHAMAREALEEAGIVISPDSLRLLHTIHRKSEIEGSTEDERVDFYFTIDSYEGKIQNKEPHKCDKMDWFAIDELPDNIIPCVKFVLQQIALGNPYSEYGW